MNRYFKSLLFTCFLAIICPGLTAAQADNWASLTQEQQNLVNEAVNAMEMAYAPYSKYHVGAAIRANDGQVYSGFNIENASYGLTICAERTALFKGITSNRKDFKEIAVVTQNGGMPCGACRQTLNEFSPNILVIVSNKDKTKISMKKLSELLPDSFGPKQLEDKS